MAVDFIVFLFFFLLVGASFTTSIYVINHREGNLGNWFEVLLSVVSFALSPDLSPELTELSQDDYEVIQRYDATRAYVVLYTVAGPLMMLNLLIAMFNNSYTQVADNSYTQWRTLRWFYVQDYERRLRWRHSLNSRIAKCFSDCCKSKAESTAPTGASESQAEDQQNSPHGETREVEAEKQQKRRHAERNFERDDMLRSVIRELSRRTTREWRAAPSEREQVINMSGRLATVQQSLNLLHDQINQERANAKLRGADEGLPR